MIEIISIFARDICPCDHAQMCHVVVLVSCLGYKNDFLVGKAILILLEFGV